MKNQKLHEFDIKTFDEYHKDEVEEQLKLSEKIKELTSQIEIEHDFASLDPFDPANFTEPQIFFLGTVSMKPSQYRGASAIYVFHNGHGILMDCAEGSYMQICDHFGDKQKVDQVLLQTKVAFITHIHGDH